MYTNNYTKIGYQREECKKIPTHPYVSTGIPLREM